METPYAGSRFNQTLPAPLQYLEGGPAMRTMSLLPAATEIVGALGLLDDLLAVSHECDYPEEVNSRPRVTRCEIYGQGLDSRIIDTWVSETLRSGGSLYKLDEEVIRSLRPE